MNFNPILKFGKNLPDSKMIITFSFLVSVISPQYTSGRNFTEKDDGQKSNNMHIENINLINKFNLPSPFHAIQLAFSPDGKRLAVGDAGSSKILIVDAGNGTTHCTIASNNHPGLGKNQLHWWPGEKLVWSPDGKYITTGYGQGKFLQPTTEKSTDRPIEFWDPATCQVTKQINASSFATKMNKTGDLIITRSNFDKKFEFHVHDIYSERQYLESTEEILIETIGWTSENKILAIGVVATDGTLKDSDGSFLKKGSLVSQYIGFPDTSTRENYLLASPVPDKSSPDGTGAPIMATNIISDFNTGKALVHISTRLNSQGEYSFQKKESFRDVSGIMVIDTLDKKILFTKYNNSELLIGNNSEIEFSGNGLHLYLLSRTQDKAMPKNYIIDSNTGAVMSQFDAIYSWGTAISRDGKKLAVADGETISLYDLK